MAAPSRLGGRQTLVGGGTKKRLPPGETFFVETGRSGVRAVEVLASKRYPERRKGEYVDLFEGMAVDGCTCSRRQLLGEEETFG